MTIEEVAATVSVACAAVAIGISVLGALSSRRANKIAQNALQVSERTFLTENHPFVTLSPIRFSKTGKYINLTPKESGFQLELMYEVRNLGSTPAMNISMPKVMRLGGPWKSKVSFTAPPRISLGPHQALAMLLRADLALSEFSAAEAVCKQYEKGELKIEIRTALDYSAETAPGLQYSVIATHQISPEMVATIAYDFATTEGSAETTEPPHSGPALASLPPAGDAGALNDIRIH